MATALLADEKEQEVLGRWEAIGAVELAVMPRAEGREVAIVFAAEALIREMVERDAISA